jgi:hypothetical protein
MAETSGTVMLESRSFRFTNDIAGMHNVTKMRFEPIRGYLSDRRLS